MSFNPQVYIITLMKQGQVFLVLDNIRSGENVGSIFRTADAAGVAKIYLCGITPIPPHPKIAKAALGAEKYVPWEYRKQTRRCLLEIKNQNAKIKIAALEQGTVSINIFKFKPKFPLALVVGNEVRGVNKKILSLTDVVVEIPMYGKKESLNVAAATGIALYQIKCKFQGVK